LLVVVDTEEEFDWAAPFSPRNISVRSLGNIDRVQKIFNRYGVTPTYVIDFPVASQPAGYGPLKEIAEAGRCAIGAHLHPWVNPPFVEQVNARNSYACNLPPDLQEAKLRILTHEIGKNLGIDAKVYKAGRYGFGPSTVGVLERLGFDVDVSINPHMNFADDGGPAFEAFDAAPFFFGQTRRILEIPCSVAYFGALPAIGPAVFGLADSPAARVTHAVGILARLNVVNRAMLSPEGHSLAELQKLTAALLSRGIRTCSLTFHSPSVEPGHTPYVCTARDLEKFLGTIDKYCEFFFGKLGGTTATLESVAASLRSRDDGSSAALVGHGGGSRLRAGRQRDVGERDHTRGESAP
jgi:hypothetical protein